MDLDSKIAILSALVQELWLKTYFQNCAQRNVYKLFKIFFDLLMGPDPSYLVLKFGDNLPNGN